LGKERHIPSFSIYLGRNREEVKGRIITLLGEGGGKRSGNFLFQSRKGERTPTMVEKRGGGGDLSSPGKLACYLGRHVPSLLMKGKGEK